MGSSAGGRAQVSIDRARDDVRAFSRAFGRQRPTPRRRLAASAEPRAAWIEEEAQELREAATIGLGPTPSST